MTTNPPHVMQYVGEHALWMRRQVPVEGHRRPHRTSAELRPERVLFASNYLISHSILEHPLSHSMRWRIVCGMREGDLCVGRRLSFVCGGHVCMCVHVCRCAIERVLLGVRLEPLMGIPCAG